MLEGSSTWRWRFSLRTVIVATVLTALVITVVKLSNELDKLRPENRRLHEERGTLVIEDPTKLQAIKVPARFAGEDRHAFRIFVPKGKAYIAAVHINKIPQSGYPAAKPNSRSMFLGSSQGQLFARLEAGEHLLSIRIVKLSDEHADIQLIRGDGDVVLDASANSPKDRWPSIQPVPYWVYDEGVERETTQADQSGRLVLLRYRTEGALAKRLGFARIEPKYPLDGMMLWLEPE